MKVIYKKSILQKMDEAIFEADSRLSGRKEIDRFILTEKEWKDVVNEAWSRGTVYDLVTSGGSPNIVIPRSYRGVPVEIED